MSTERKSLLFDLLLPKLEIVAWIAAVGGFIARWNQVTGGTTFLLIGLSTLSTVYFSTIYKPLNLSVTNSSQQYPLNTSGTPSFLMDVLAPKIVGISGAVILVGTLFKLLFWNGSALMLLVGTITMLVIVLLLALNQRMNGRAILLAAIGSLMLYVSSETWVRQFHRNDPALVELMLYRLHHPRDRAAAEAVRVHLQQKRTRR